MVDGVPALTKSQVNKAGRVIRLAFTDADQTELDIDRALGLIEAFRIAHREPLHSAYMGLKSAVATNQLQGQLSIPPLGGHLV